MGTMETSIVDSSQIFLQFNSLKPSRKIKYLLHHVCFGTFSKLFNLRLLWEIRNLCAMATYNNMDMYI